MDAQMVELIRILRRDIDQARLKATQDQCGMISRTMRALGFDPLAYDIDVVTARVVGGK